MFLSVFSDISDCRFYFLSFYHIAKLNSIRVLLSIAANLDWPLFQFDIKNAFLNGDLDEEIYMRIPPGFENEVNNGKVCIRLGFDRMFPSVIGKGMG